MIIERRTNGRAAAICTLIAAAKLNDINPRTRLADGLGRIADHPALRLSEPSSWCWKMRPGQTAAA